MLNINDIIMSCILIKLVIFPNGKILTILANIITKITPIKKNINDEIYLLNTTVFLFTGKLLIIISTSYFSPNPQLDKLYEVEIKNGKII
nr:hypothetical protein [Clostridium felsineum]